MGYYTQHTLVSITDIKDIGKCYTETNQKESPDYEFFKDQIGLHSEYGGFVFEEPCKWYNFEQDMKSFSLQYPILLFTILTEGEESGDIFTHYFLNGKTQREPAEITFKPFDINKLK